MISFYSSPTPNGYKVAILLEELGLDYDLKVIDLGKNEQKEPWFLRLNPNGRIPVIVDHDNDDFPVFESGAIMLYLAERTKQFIPEDPKEKMVMMQWLMFQMGGLGPMQGQAHVFHRYFPERIPSVIERYQNETRRLYDVLDRRLQSSQFLAGDQLTIADFANWCWVRSYEWAGVSIEGLSALELWLRTIDTRPAVQRGLLKPPRPDAGETLVQTGQNMLAR